jgi:putative phosphoribosyl transferase
MTFRDRHDAGARLALRLAERGFEAPVVLALPRGGVPVGYEVASALGAPLDLLLVRKVGVPWQPELAMGAVVDGQEREVVLHEEVVRALGIPEEEVHRAAAREVAEIERRRALYLRGRSPVDVAGRTVIVVDDGIATGTTMRAALRALRRRGPQRLVLAVPVAAPEALEALRGEVDEVVCLRAPRELGAIGFFYHDFHQLSDAEVRELLDRAARRAGSEGRESGRAAARGGGDRP